MEKVCDCRRSNCLPRDVEQRCHTAEKRKRTAELSELSFEILIQDFGSNGHPTVARLAIAGKVELLPMTWTEKNCVILLDLQHFIIQRQGQGATVNHSELVAPLPARPEAATLGVQDIPNRHPTKLHPGVGYRQMLSRCFRVSSPRPARCHLTRATS